MGGGGAIIGGGAGGPAVNLGSGLGGGVFVPGAINTSGAYNNPINPYAGGYGGGGGFAGILANLAASGMVGGPAGPVCPFADPQFGTNTGQNMAFTNAFGQQMGQTQYDGMANQYAYPPQADQRAWGNLGQQFNSKLNGNCPTEIHHQRRQTRPMGDLKPTAKSRRILLLSYSTLHAICRSSVLDSIRLVPMQKLRFYTYMFMSMAQPESTCNPTAVGKGPNGAAIGLFQLETKACDPVGVHGTSQQLLQPKQNIDCAVALLGHELDKRGSITVGTSRGFTGTYWATLRSDAVQRAASSNGIIRQDGNAAQSNRIPPRSIQRMRNWGKSHKQPNRRHWPRKRRALVVGVLGVGDSRSVRDWRPI